MHEQSVIHPMWEKNSTCASSNDWVEEIHSYSWKENLKSTRTYRDRPKRQLNTLMGLLMMKHSHSLHVNSHTLGITRSMCKWNQHMAKWRKSIAKPEENWKSTRTCKDSPINQLINTMIKPLIMKHGHSLHIKLKPACASSSYPWLSDAYPWLPLKKTESTTTRQDSPNR